MAVSERPDGRLDVASRWRSAGAARPRERVGRRCVHARAPTLIWAALAALAPGLACSRSDEAIGGLAREDCPDTVPDELRDDVRSFTGDLAGFTAATSLPTGCVSDRCQPRALDHDLFLER